MAEVKLTSYVYNSTDLAFKHVKKLSLKEARLLIDEEEKMLSFSVSCLYHSMGRTMDMGGVV